MMERNYPTKGTIVVDSFVSMLMAYLIQLGLLLLLGGIYSIFAGAFGDFLVYGLFWTLYSGLVMSLAWLIVFLPFYTLTYKTDWLYESKWRVLLIGIIVGFLVPFGAMALYGGGVSHARDTIYILLATVAAICGGAAAEGGCRLRHKALRRAVNVEYVRERARKTGPLKVLSEI